MVAGYLLLTLLILFLAFASFLTLNSTIEVARAHSAINQLEIYTLNLIRNDNNFLEKETINENYFSTHQSKIIRNRDSLNILIGDKILELKQRRNIARDKTSLTALAEIDSALIIYNKTFEALERIIFERGFKDYGLEGGMRVHAHELEETAGHIALSDILSLRRHEKDFMLRHDTMYIIAFRAKADKLLQNLQKSPAKNQEAIEHLLEYQRLFLKIAGLTKQMGLTINSGLHYELNALSEFMSLEFFQLSEFSYRQSLQAQEKAKILYVIILAGAIISSILSGYWISKRLTEPITWLSKLVNNTMQTRNGYTVDLSLRNAADEIIVLTSSFKKLIEQTKHQMMEIQDKSHLLRKRNKELKRLNQELDQFLYSSAHDMRSPLSSLLGLIHLAKLDNKDQQLVPYFLMMEKSVHRQEYFIGQIVNYSKNKITTLQPEKIEWQKLIQSVLEDNQFVPGAQRLNKQVIIKDAYDFFSDKSRIGIILNNLISNAVRYADLNKPDPYIRIEVITTSSEATIMVTDNGIGIGEHHLGKIFGMFYRAHSHSNGSGLGLFIVSKTVKRMKGMISVESEEMQSTKFVIRLPMLALYPPATVKFKDTVPV
jgi:signal transduction histidine kinase